MNIENLPEMVTVQGVFDTECGPGPNGSCVAIYKDKTSYVHRDFVPFVLEKGGRILENGEEVVVTPPAEKTPEQEKHEKLVQVCNELILVNEVRNFTRGGRPRIEVVRAMVEFDVTTDELRDAYEAAIQGTPDGDTSQQSADQSSNPAS